MEKSVIEDQPVPGIEPAEVKPVVEIGPIYEF